MGYQVRTAKPSEIPALVAAMDQQFVFGKGRAISLAQRFPKVYVAGNANNIFVVEDCGEIVSALACKCFALQEGGVIWQGAMIGGVFTLAARRGAGLASLLLEQVAKTLQERGLDFAVLWTGQPEFYARLGWVLADCGVLGDWQADLSASPSVDISLADATLILPAHAADAAYINQLRQHWCRGSLPLRGNNAYLQLPLPADSVELLQWGQGMQDTAYAILGQAGDTGIMYEMAGNPIAYPSIWASVSARYTRVLVNDAPATDSQRWLVENTSAKWQDKALAMWMPLSAKVKMSDAAAWYIPYFDRV